MSQVALVLQCGTVSRIVDLDGDGMVGGFVNVPVPAGVECKPGYIWDGTTFQKSAVQVQLDAQKAKINEIAGALNANILALVKIQLL